MESHSEQHFNDLAKKVYKSTSIESPSLDFTSKVMAKLEGQTSTAFQPLISKKGWFGIAAVIIGVITFSFFGNVQGLSFLENVDLSILSNNKVSDTLSSIQLSQTLVYCVAIFGAAWLFYVPLMKNMVDKRLQF